MNQLRISPLAKYPAVSWKLHGARRPVAGFVRHRLYLEIQIEGANGWASALPTWRIETKWLLWLTSGKPLTGYHVWLNALLILCCICRFGFAPGVGLASS
jgi:hypothetical protein